MSTYTTLFDGRKLPKHHVRVQALGTLDELVAVLGALAVQAPVTTQNWLVQLQEELLAFGSCLALVNDLADDSQHSISLQRLEAEIDQLNENLPSLSHFILPGGTPLAAGLHVARAVARRWERCLSELSSQESVSPTVLAYSNRLSDYLFAFARYVNHSAGISERIWKNK